MCTILNSTGNLHLFCAPDCLNFLSSSQCCLRDCYPLCADNILSFLSEFWMLFNYKFQVQVSTWTILTLVSLLFQGHWSIILNSRGYFNVFLDLLNQNTRCFTISTRVLNYKSDSFASYTLQMHNDWVLPINGRSRPSTC